ncbi:MAG: hypothetical protein P8O03_03130 [Ilumatobacter sp.]|nr:hypothetical protein [Ilumatobacter sp.]
MKFSATPLPSTGLRPDWLLAAMLVVVATVGVSTPASAEPRAIHEGIHGPFHDAERGEQTQTRPDPKPPEPARAPSFIPGDCESVRRVFDYFDPSGESSRFFVDRGIARRESGCARDTLNERSGDTGVVQINPVHNRAGYFGGQYFAAGGWLYALHGLRTRQNIMSPEWANAAVTLRQVCGDGPWSGSHNYSCANRKLKR